MPGQGLVSHFPRNADLWRTLWATGPQGNLSSSQGGTCTWIGERGPHQPPDPSRKEKRKALDNCPGEMPALTLFSQKPLQLWSGAQNGKTGKGW